MLGLCDYPRRPRVLYPAAGLPYWSGVHTRWNTRPCLAALTLELLELLKLVDFRLGKHELSAFFRKQGHKNYRACQDQILRNFLNGVQQKYREVK